MSLRGLHKVKTAKQNNHSRNRHSHKFHAQQQHVNLFLQIHLQSLSWALNGPTTWFLCKATLLSTTSTPLLSTHLSRQPPFFPFKDPTLTADLVSLFRVLLCWLCYTHPITFLTPFRYIHPISCISPRPSQSPLLPLPHTIYKTQNDQRPKFKS